MFDWFKDVHMTYPFILAAGVPQPRISVSRIVEAVIIAIIAAVGASYLTVQKLDLKQDQAQKQFEDQVKRRNEEVASIKAEFKENVIKQQAQYEILRGELQRIALATERLKPR